MKSFFVILFMLLTMAVPDGHSQSAGREQELAQANGLTAQLVELFKAQRYNEALPLGQRVVEIRQRLLSRDDPSLGTAYANLGELYFELKKDNLAEEAFKQALTVYEAKPDSNADLIAKTLDRMAYLRFLKRDYEKAAGLYVRSLEIKEKKSGGTSPETIQSLKNYACATFLAGGSKRDYQVKDEPKSKLRARAMCWLSGFKDDCGKTDSADSQGILNGKALKLVQPPYTREAREKRLSGKVLIAVLIDEAGNVIKAKPVCGGHPELNAAGLQSAYASKFSSTKVNDQPVQVTGMLVYNFVIQ